MSYSEHFTYSVTNVFCPVLQQSKSNRVNLADFDKNSENICLLPSCQR